MRKLAIIVFLSFVLLTGMIVLYSTSRSRSPSAYIYSAKGLKRLKKHPAGSPEGCGVDVMIMRHCEKGTLRAHCTKEGLRRAEFLATLFGDTEEEVRGGVREMQGEGRRTQEDTWRSTVHKWRRCSEDIPIG